MIGEKRINKKLQQKKMVQQKEEIRKRTVYIPQMNYAGAKTLAAVLRSVDIDSAVSPDDNQKAFDLAGKYLSGEECLPERITLGGILNVLMDQKQDPKKVGFFMPTAGGPCRFGQYKQLIQKILIDLKYDDVLLVSPSTKDGYKGITEASTQLVRTAWLSVVSSDLINKILYRTRPYELNKGDADEVFIKAIDETCIVLEKKIPYKYKLKELVCTLEKIQVEFSCIPARYTRDRILIGIVGEIFCRMNTFSNEDLIRKVEDLGGECWLSDLSEWIWYTNRETIKRILDAGRRFSKDMLYEKIKNWIQRHDEHQLLMPFEEDLKGYEEPDNIHVILNASLPYLPVDGALGEMVLSAGKAIYLYRKGVDGIIDISPFSCMNGIITEAVYPRISRNHGNIPIKNFYFDGSVTDLESDLDIFLELSRNYQRKKKINRVYPKCFGVDSSN